MLAVFMDMETHIKKICSAILIIYCLMRTVEAGEVEICRNETNPARRPVLHGSIPGQLSTVKQLYDIRSKVECAIYCEEEKYCRTALFQADNGICHLVMNFTQNMNITNVPDLPTYDIVQMKAFKNIESACPSTCVAPAICIYDCSGTPGTPPICADVSKSQYGTGCQFQPIIQSTEYYLRNYEKDTSADSDTYFSVVFPKLYSWSMLKVKLRGSMRAALGGCNGMWGMWRILFNNSHCGNPGAIEAAQYNWETDTDHYKSTGIQGVCNNLPAGNVTITLIKNGWCTWQRLGWGTDGTRLFVEELNQTPIASEPPLNSCPNLPIFNTRVHVTTSEWGHDPVTTLWNVQYTKMESSTGLRINLDFVTRLYNPSTSSYCLSWVVKIDNNDCSPYPFVKTVANLGGSGVVGDEYRSVEVEGHCYSISAGTHTLSLIVEACRWEYQNVPADAYTGFRSANMRWIVEEFRTGTNVAAVMGADNIIYRIPEFNIMTTGAMHISNGNDNGVVWILPNYSKIYAATGFRFAMSADARNYYGPSPCCRHYVVINGAECANPGTLEAISYLGKTINLHRPIYIDGICTGIPAGTVTIQIYAGACRGGYAFGDCHFGWNCGNHVMMSETFVDRQIITF